MNNDIQICVARKRLRQTSANQYCGGADYVAFPSRYGLSSTLKSMAMGILVFLTFAPHARNAFARAQDDSTSVCGCSPPTYTFQIDFSLFCPPIEIDGNPGIKTLSCLISPFGAPTSDLVPTVITHVDVLELDQSNNVLAQERIEGDFLNGDSFSYTSILNRTNEIASTEEIPSALQLNLNARNEAGVTVINVFVISFTNQCGSFPVFEDGESAGWAIFGVLGDPVILFCPTFPPTNAPSDPFTDQPTMSPAPRPEETLTSSPRPETDPPTGDLVTPTRSPVTQPPTAGPTITGLPSIPIAPSGMPMLMDMSMSMSMIVAVEWNFRYSLRDELDLLDEYFHNKKMPESGKRLADFEKTENGRWRIP